VKLNNKNKEKRKKKSASPHNIIVVCGIIAFLAIWADFGFMESPRIFEIYPQQWQRDYTVAHVFVRDIFLLLLPIATLLVWTVRNFSLEIKGQKSILRKLGFNK
jgi:hypothetical protein